MLEIEEEDKEGALNKHSEKLAIAFALLKTPRGSSIRMVKNLRVCGDCHSATKLISLIYNRDTETGFITLNMDCARVKISGKM